MNASQRVDRIALVTGASRGLGRALCEQLATAGYVVMPLCRPVIDLADPAASAKALERCLQGLDLASIGEFVFVSNAATLDPLGPIEHQPAEALARSLNVNLVSPVALIGTLLRLLETSPARKLLLNITSGSAATARSGVAHYSAAKAGMEQFVRCLAADQMQATHPAVVVNVDPGAMDTAMQTTLRSAAPDVFPDGAQFAARHARGELADPAAVAAAIVRLAQSPSLVSGSRQHVRDPM